MPVLSPSFRNPRGLDFRNFPVFPTSGPPLIPSGIPSAPFLGGGSEPPDASSTIPGLPDDIFGIPTETIIGAGDIIRRTFFNGGADLPVDRPLVADSADCGPFEVMGEDGICRVLGVPGFEADPTKTGAGKNGAPAKRGQAVHGRFGVGELPIRESMTVRRCPAGMALGKDGVCYDGLGRNSPKRQWPMGMRPLLTPGERNAIRIAGRAAGKLQRSKRSLRKAARALEKVS